MNQLRKIRIRFLNMRVNWIDRRMERIEKVCCWRLNRLERRANRLLARAEKIHARIKCR